MEPQTNVSSKTQIYIRVAISIVAVVLMCAFIFSMSAEPAEQSDEISLGVAWHIVSFIVPGYGDMSAADQLHWQEMLNHPVRKTAHFLEYAVLGALMMNMLVQITRAMQPDSETSRPAPNDEAKEQTLRRADSEEKRQKSLHISKFDPTAPHALRSLAIAAWALSTLYAATDEIHQMFVPGRAGMVTDILLDSSGVLTGVFLCWLVFSCLAKRKRKKSGSDNQVH